MLSTLVGLARITDPNTEPFVQYTILSSSDTLETVIPGKMS